MNIQKEPNGIGWTRGQRLYQPKPHWVQGMIEIADQVGIPVYMKNNLAWDERRVDFPQIRG